jgi:hypothetical protein
VNANVRKNTRALHGELEADDEGADRLGIDPVDLKGCSLARNRQRDDVPARITRVEAGDAVSTMALHRHVDMDVRSGSMMMIGMVVIDVRMDMQSRTACGQPGHTDADNKRDPSTHEASLASFGPQRHNQACLKYSAHPFHQTAGSTRRIVRGN